MNKKVIDECIPIAYQALQESGIVEEGEGGIRKINKNFKGQISSFGAAVTMGSLLSAVAFFSDKGSSAVDRSKLMDAILIVLKKQKKAQESQNKLYEYINEKYEGHLNHEEVEAVIREEIINIAIAVKLAMNMYILES